MEWGASVKRRVTLASIVFFIAGLTASGSAFGSFLPGYQLVWADEFNGTALNQSTWSYRGGGGFYSYQRPENVSVHDGALHIALKQESYQGYSYTGGGVLSNRTFQYGYVETSAKMFNGYGWHESFWATYAAQPLPGQNGIEVDCFEQPYGTDMRHYSQGVTKWTTDIDGNPVPDSFYLQNSVNAHTDLSAAFHTYGFELTPSVCNFYRDGQKVGTTSMSGIAPWVPLDIYLSCIATATGAATPGDVQFDYLRVYTLVPEPSMGAATTIGSATCGLWMLRRRGKKTC
jgi:beta-glucanase (GH16 family)